MPIYEYHCTACAHHLEAFQKMSDEPLKDCPACQKPTLTKWVSAAGFELKGTGWYATDFRTKSTGSQASSSAPASSDEKPAASETPTSQASSSSDSSSSSTSSSSSGAAT